MKRVPPWHWNIWGPWPPKGTSITEEEIRQLAHLLGQLDTSRSAEENWIKASNELAEPLPWSAFVRWLGFSDKKGWDWLDFLSRLSAPILVGFGVWYLSSKATTQQQRISFYQRDFSIVSDYMKEVKTLLLDKDLNFSPPDLAKRRLIRNLTLTALNQVYDPASRTLIARFLICGSDVVPINITPPISWSSAVLRNTDLKGCKLTNIDLRWADLRGSDLKGKFTNLTNSKLTLSLLQGADIRDAIMVNANLYGSHLQKADLRGANLSNADLSMADLSRADLRGANLMKANLGSTGKPPGTKNEHGAILKDVHLEGADLKDADLTGAYLTGASLSGADLRGVKWDATTHWPERVKVKHAKNIPQKLRLQLGI